MWLRLIGVGLGIALAAQSISANAQNTNAAGCKSDGNERSENGRGAMRVDAKQENEDQTWVVYNRVFLVDGDEKKNNDKIEKLGTKYEKLMREDLRTSGDGKKIK